MKLFEVFPTLENSTLVLKRMSIDDLPELEKISKEEEVYHLEPTFLPEKLAKSPKEFLLSDLEKLRLEKSSLILGIYPKKAATHFIGIAEIYGYDLDRNKASIGYRLKKEEWHKGYGTSVVSLLKDYLRNEVGIERITAHVRLENIASAKCLLKNGFVQRRESHLEDWGYSKPIMANKYVIYPEGE